MSTPTTLSLTDFTAYELPAKKWMKLVRPRMRLRVRLPYQNRDFVSAPVTLGNNRSTIDGRAGTNNFESAGWPWNDDNNDGERNDGRRVPQPCLVDDDVFEVEIERRFLLWWKCIRRTQPSTIDQVRIGDHCALSLYDERRFADVPEERIEVGEITFTLRSNSASRENVSSDGSKVSFTTCA